MPRIFDFGGREVERSVTVAGLRALKGTGRHAAQVTAETADEAAAAEAAGVEMVVCRAANVLRVREGSRRVFVTAALGFADAVTGDEILRTAFSAITSGADAVITGRGHDSVRLLANEQIPVMGHLGFVPRKSTWVGGIRAVGKTSAEALELWDRFRRLEDAGAFAVECEIIAAEVMAEINRRTSLVTVSLGSGTEADVIFLFTSDICGESARLPRHARTWGNLAALHQAVRDARVEALSGFRKEVAGGSYPNDAEVAGITEAELEEFRKAIASVKS
ncbi:3-methyl-2-oxobutanoate hydroxymethyltransferase [Mesorhizobium sp. YC-39]|uniref:3-methyl-2-oxobutanoate hydroxymethyltransferase n=1 Tax=unclassified Mesorhizobium TaxID=325217 RepID=UPI0021E7A023|nr:MULTISPECIES: 3-methyl-2-oxobutanoate hydroxymethyltransferase [unclassified Mesorhizobium]MCV3210880.1 3-methyl-2-oxobutanoate hydroxymethyltransferase [Mesorhizobium sp. YC-2]MCV3231114.1 3-methyl-2-oxobutanoate hydroxymethyltransferase [Mesorhizobium sp. YC-39]